MDKKIMTILHIINLLLWIFVTTKEYMEGSDNPAHPLNCFDCIASSIHKVLKKMKNLAKNKTYFLRIVVFACLTLCPLGNFFCLFVVCWFFSRSTFMKNSFKNHSECQTVWIQIRPDVASGLIWVQTVCKSYQQTTLGGEELMSDFTHLW